MAIAGWKHYAVPSTPSVVADTTAMTTVDLDDVAVTLIGHPFAPIGMGEQLRSYILAMNAMHLHHGVLDIFRHAPRTDATHHAIMGDRERAEVPGGIRIFHVNGDEVGNVVEALERYGGRLDDGHNIIVPAWELSAYPPEWAAELKRFDEVWALSRFIQDSLSDAGVASHLIGQSVELPEAPLLPRRYFGLRESAFVLLNFFDLSSYAARKNPDAVLDLFRRTRAAAPFLDVQLVLKVKNAAGSGAEWAASIPPDPAIRIIDEPLDSFAVRGLIAACDCFVSLHRSEGFGRGLGEAMLLGRLVMGTGWSGNLDFMTAENSLLVDHRMIALKPDEYPHWHGQSWADPDLDHAEALLWSVLADPERGRTIALRGQADVLRTHSHRAVGLRILTRLEEIVRDRRVPTARAAPPPGKRARKKVPARI